MQGARVSVGMPALNAEATIGRALSDLVAQTYSDIEIIVCDNASDDSTADIAEAFAQRDNRIRVIRFDKRADILHSFRRVLDQCEGTYFMFAPADDRWYPRFIESTIASLDAQPSLAACCPRIAYTFERRFLYISVGTRPLSGTHRQRLRSYFAEPADAFTRLYALYRREALAGSFPEAWFPGWDYVLIANTLAHGEHSELPLVLMERDRTPDLKYIAEFDAYYGRGWRRWLPLIEVARATWRQRTTPADIGLIWNLALFVLRSHEYYAIHRTRRYGRCVSWLARLIRLGSWSFCAPRVAAAQVPTAIKDGRSPRAARSSRISWR